ncbi:MAG: LamG-like jellyroll fold domain-containing protein [Bacteroidota bacterium]
MKKISFILLLLSFTVAKAQEEREEKEAPYLPELMNVSWFKAIFTANPEYIKVKKEFEAYVKANPSVRSKQRRDVERWLEKSAFFLDANGRVDEPRPILPVKKNTAIGNTLSQTTAGTYPYSGSWKMIGPFQFRVKDIAVTQSSAAVAGGYCIMARINPADTNMIFAGYQTGGLWRTTDNGNNWELVDVNLGKEQMIDLDVVAAYPSQMYTCSNSNVFKSKDDGASWAAVAADPGTVWDIAASPTDTNKVVVRTSNSLLYTTNGGTSWNTILTGLSNLTAPWNNHSSEILYWDPSDNNRVIYTDYSESGNSVKVYVSTNAGQNFTLDKTFVPGRFAAGSVVSWVKIMKASTQADQLYLAVGEGVGSAYSHNTTHIQVYDLTAKDTIEGWKIDRNIHHGDIAMSTTNHNNIVSGTYSPSVTYVSTDGGKTSVSSGNMHPDIRTIDIVQDKVVVGNDGQIATYRLGDISKLRSISDKISNVELWGFSASEFGDFMSGGENHGPITLREHDADGGWWNIGGADSDGQGINPNDDKWLVGHWGYGYNVYEHTAPFTLKTYSATVSPGGSSRTPTYHPHYTRRMVTYNGNVANTLAQSNDNGITASTLATFSDIVFRVEVARTNSAYVYVVVGKGNNNKLWKSVDSGKTFINITPTLAQSSNQTNIADIALCDTSENVLFVAYANNQTACKLLQSNDGGTSYANITGTGMPTNAITKIGYQRGTSNHIYMALSNAGIYHKTNGEANWQILGNGLAASTANWFNFNYTKNTIILGTNRGAWEHALAEPSRLRVQFTADGAIVDVCSNNQVQFRNTSIIPQGSTATYLWTFQDGTPATSTALTPLVTFSGSGFKSVSLEVTVDGNTKTLTMANLVKTADTCASCQQAEPVAGNAASFSTTAPVAGPVLVTGYNSLANTNRFTITGWIRPKATHLDYSAVFMAQNESSSCGVNFRAVNSFQVGIHWKGTSYWSYNTGLVAVPNEWNHVALVVYPDSAILYLNGKSYKYNLPFVAANFQDILLGSFPTRSDRNYNGLLDEFRIYNRSLSRDEIRALRHLTVPDVATENGLIGYLQFNDAKDCVLDKKRVASVASRPFNSTNYTISTAPVGAGTSEKKSITAIGTYNYGLPGVSLDFQAGTTPNGEVWVTRLNTLPFNTDNSLFYPQAKYYIINNYGSNTTFNTPGLTFNNVSLPNPAYVEGKKLYLKKRGDNKDSLVHWSANLDSVQLSSNGTNLIDVPFNNTQITNFSQFLIHASAPVILPIKITYFNAQLTNKDAALLRWKFEETQATKVEILHSVNGADYAPVYIALKEAGVHTMQFQHDNLMTGRHFYRLKITDAAGIVSYSNTETITVKVEGKIVIHPNPVSKGIVYLKNTGGHKGEISMYDIEGRLMQKNTLTGQMNQDVKVSSLQVGTYVVSIMFADKHIENMLLQVVR